MKEKGMGEYLSLSATYLYTAWSHEQLQIRDVHGGGGSAAAGVAAVNNSLSHRGASRYRQFPFFKIAAHRGSGNSPFKIAAHRGSGNSPFFKIAARRGSGSNFYRADRVAAKIVGVFF